MQLGRLLISLLPQKTLFLPVDKKIAIALSGILVLLYAIISYNYYSDGIYSLDGMYQADGTHMGGDFVVFWTATALALRGQLESIFDVSTFHALQEQLIGGELPKYLPWGYPPHFLLMILPLGFLPFVAALFAWFVTTLSLYCWASYLVLGRDRVWLAIILAPSTFVNIQAGQNGFLTAALFVIGFTQLRSRPYFAGILFGLLTIKPQLGVLIPFALLAGRHWKAILGAACTTGILVAASMAAFGAQVWTTYFTTATAFHRNVFEYGQGIFLLKMPTVFTGIRILGFDAAVGYSVQVIMAASIAIVIVFAFRRRGNDQLNLSLIAFGTFLVTPFAFGYDMTLTSVAALILLAQCVREGVWPGERAALALVWILPIGLMVINAISLPLGPLLVLGCFVYVALRIFHSAIDVTRSGT